MGVSNIMLQAGAMPEVVDSIVNNIGIDMFDEEIDDVIFQTNDTGVLHGPGSDVCHHHGGGHGV